MENRVLICTEDPELYLLLNHILSVEGFPSQLADGDADVESCLQKGGLLAVIFDGVAWHGDIVALCSLSKQAGLAVGALIAGDMRTMHLQMIKAGLDDGIMRPLDPERLLAFLRHARRAAGNPSAFGEVPPSALPTHISVSSDSRRVTISGRHLALTSIESRILETLVRNGNRTCSRGDLLTAVWREPHDVGARTVDVHIARLRKALSVCHDVRIKTVYGEGYALVSTRKGEELRVAARR
ncbi:response regulator CheY-like domain-containing protein (plasmid) [Rhizobium gallicum]|uniref:Response regulator CheY-like domain-containing protein n=1 Tax=Rhizobium gallicum TaxID=56730 RepID=A0A1L5NRX4_9HYPH|nr:response regulator transcription factor [Rhizobium gallicum]APO70628.1 response regulator CheY-like domain-containing protein [Rhizobium gallicum]